MKVELNHDVIAKQVYEKASGDMKARRRVETMVFNAYEFYQRRGALMTSEQLDELKPLRQHVNLSPEEWAFIQKSEQALQIAHRRRRMIIASIIAILTALTLVALWNWRKATIEKNKANANLMATQAQQAFQNKNINEALRLAKESLKINPDNPSTSEVLNAAFHYTYDHYAPICISTIKNHRAFTTGSLSPDGNKAALINADSTLYIYDISPKYGRVFESGVEQRVTFNHCDTTFAPIFSPDNNRVIFQKPNNELVLYNLNDKNEQILRGHTDYVRGAIFIKNDNILTWSNDGLVKMWDFQGNLLKNFGKTESEIDRVLLSPDSSGIAVLNGGSVNLFRLYTEGSSVIQNEVMVSDIAFEDDRTIALITSEGYSNWSVKGNRLSPERPISSIQRGRFVQLTKQGERVLYINYQTLTLISEGYLNDKKEENSQNRSDEHYESAYEVALTGYHPYENMFWAVPYGQNQVEFLNFEGNQQVVLTHSMQPTGVVFNKDGQKVLTFSADGVAKIWDDEATHPVELKEVAPFTTSLSTQAKFFPNDSSITTFAYSAPFKVFNEKTGKIKEIDSKMAQEVFFSPDGQHIIYMNGKPTLHDEKGKLIKELDFESNGFKDLKFSKDGKYFAIFENNIVKIWDRIGNLITDKIEINKLHLIKQVAFSNDASKIYIATQHDSIMSEWDIRGSKLRVIATKEVIQNMAFSPKNDIMITTNTEGVVKIRNMDGSVKKQWQSENERIGDAGFLPDGSMIYTRSEENGAIKLWTLEGKMYKALFNGSSQAGFFEFLPDNKHIVVSFSHAAQLWSNDGQQIATLNRITKNDKGVTDVAVSKDGKKILLSFGEGIVRQYRTPQGILEWLNQHPNIASF